MSIGFLILIYYDPAHNLKNYTQLLITYISMYVSNVCSCHFPSPPPPLSWLQKVEGTFARRPSYTTPASDLLILHIHGGGFVSQSVKTHEVRTHSVLSEFRPRPVLNLVMSLTTLCLPLHVHW